MTVTPQGVVNLCKAPLEVDNFNQLTFANIEEQQAYFISITKQSLNDYTYIKTDSSIIVDFNIDKIINYNYLYYQNIGFSNKIYYCFITSMEYLSENSTRINIATDVFQTWQFDIIYKPSFVEREHVNNDAIGLHTINENLETGEMIVNNQGFLLSVDGTYIVLAVTGIIGNPSVIPNKSYGGIYGGLYYLATDNPIVADALIRTYNTNTDGYTINSIFLIPNDFPLGDNTITILIGDTTYQYYQLSYPTVTNLGNITIKKPTSLNGYVPKNNKLLCYPYNYFYLTNNSGAQTLFRYELFNNEPTFKLQGVITPGCQIKAIPTNYRNSNNLYDNSISLGKLPVCSWITDVYINWLTQNGVNIDMSILSSASQFAVGVAQLGTGAIGEAMGVNNIISGIKEITSTMTSIETHKMAPDECRGNINCGDITYSSGNLKIEYFKMCIREEYAKIIDNYFSMYGYKVNALKIPNITGRPNWNYVKTINCNIDGDIPQADIEEIKNLFNVGITLWHNPATFLNYDIINK